HAARVALRPALVLAGRGGAVVPRLPPGRRTPRACSGPRGGVDPVFARRASRQRARLPASGRRQRAQLPTRRIQRRRLDRFAAPVLGGLGYRFARALRVRRVLQAGSGPVVKKRPPLARRPRSGLTRSKRVPNAEHCAGASCAGRGSDAGGVRELVTATLLLREPRVEGVAIRSLGERISVAQTHLRGAQAVGVASRVLDARALSVLRLRVEAANR